MDDVVKNKLVESIDSVSQWVSSAGSFIEEQAPLIAQEVIAWGQARHIAGMCTSMLIFLILLYLWYKFVKWFKRDNEAGPLGIPLFAVTCGILIWFGICVYNYLFVMFAPRLYIVEQLKDLIR